MLTLCGTIYCCNLQLRHRVAMYDALGADFVELAEQFAVLQERITEAKERLAQLDA